MENLRQNMIRSADSSENSSETNSISFTRSDIELSGPSCEAFRNSEPIEKSSQPMESALVNFSEVPSQTHVVENCTCDLNQLFLMNSSTEFLPEVSIDLLEDSSCDHRKNVLAMSGFCADIVENITQPLNHVTDSSESNSMSSKHSDTEVSGSSCKAFRRSEPIEKNSQPMDSALVDISEVPSQPRVDENCSCDLNQLFLMNIATEFVPEVSIDLLEDSLNDHRKNVLVMSGFCADIVPFAVVDDESDYSSSYDSTASDLSLVCEESYNADLSSDGEEDSSESLEAQKNLVLKMQSVYHKRSSRSSQRKKPKMKFDEKYYGPMFRTDYEAENPLIEFSSSESEPENLEPEDIDYDELMDALRDTFLEGLIDSEGVMLLDDLLDQLPKTQKADPLCDVLQTYGWLNQRRGLRIALDVNKLRDLMGKTSSSEDSDSDDAESPPTLVNLEDEDDVYRELLVVIFQLFDRAEVDDEGVLRTADLLSKMSVQNIDELCRILDKHEWLERRRGDRIGLYVEKLNGLVRRNLEKRKYECQDELSHKNMVVTNHFQSIYRTVNDYKFSSRPTSICFYCDTSGTDSIKDLWNHLEITHGAAMHSQEAQKMFHIRVEVSEDLTGATLFMKNIQQDSLTIDEAEFEHDKIGGHIIKNIIVPAGDTYEIPLERKFFGRYAQESFWTLTLRSGYNFYEVQHLTVTKSLQEITAARRQMKRVAGSDVFNGLPLYLPAPAVRKCFQSYATLELSEFNHLKALVDYYRNGYELDATNYVNIFKLFMELEDAYVDQSLCNIRLKDVKILKKGHDYAMRLRAGECVPSAVKEGDLAIVDGGKRIYSFPVKKMDREYIYIHVDYKEIAKLNIRDNFYDATFRKDRTTIQYEHDALVRVRELVIREVLFPYKFGLREDRNEYTFKWHNKSMISNPEQQQAVRNIVKNTSYPAPYIIFGPPGTGKTTTIIEAIVQIYKLKPKARILVTAPTNFATDEISKRLLNYIRPEDLYRFYARSIVRKLKDIDEDLIMISNFSMGAFIQTSNIQLSMYRIILTTLTTSGKFGQRNLDPDTFDYIFIDECGSAREPQSLIPIGGLVSRCRKKHGTNIVLSGDPKQLGPTISYEFINLLGLGTSMLERLMATDFYQKDLNGKYNTKVITKLLQNYRSHPEILNIPNMMFYDGELIPKATEENINFALGWEYLNNKTVPIIVVSVEGATESMKNSTSLSNQAEADVVMAYLEEIITNGINGNMIPLHEIGVCSPYTLQCYQLKKRLCERDWGDIEVGSAEKYQGKEKSVMILSTVRSKTSSAGFLGCPKRMNVIMTRAKGLLIIVCNPTTLQLDPNWRLAFHFLQNLDVVVGDGYHLQDLNLDQAAFDAEGIPIVRYEERFAGSLESQVRLFWKSITTRCASKIDLEFD